jgi:dihydrofolate synthase / folylpolyglutamate synthase
MVYGALRDKAVAEMTSLLFPLADRVILTAPANTRAMPPEDIAAQGARITHSTAEAISLLGDATSDTVIFITGSLYLAGEARSLLKKREVVK